MTGQTTLRILLLHGYTQNGSTFQIKCRNIERAVRSHFYRYQVEFEYPTGPISIIPSLPQDFEDYNEEWLHAISMNMAAWWRYGSDALRGGYMVGLETSLDLIGSLLRKANSEAKPFDGVIGFSQGACFAAVITALLDPARVKAISNMYGYEGRSLLSAFVSDDDLASEQPKLVHPPFRFQVLCSGFASPAIGAGAYQAIWTPRIDTSSLHFIAVYDPIVELELSLRLVDACVPSSNNRERIVRFYPGGHWMPGCQPKYAAEMVHFISRALGQAQLAIRHPT